MIKLCYCKEKLDACHYWGLEGKVSKRVVNRSPIISSDYGAITKLSMYPTNYMYKTECPSQISMNKGCDLQEHNFC